jgi:hypothetical protein
MDPTESTDNKKEIQVSSASVMQLKAELSKREAALQPQRLPPTNVSKLKVIPLD